jgi:ubiquinone/menaquinone biosynthesis C-methylase UbiE
MSEEKLTQEEVWDELANQWNNFRQKPHKDVEKRLNEVLNEWKPGKILDIGCGNCRNAMIFCSKGFKCYGIDFSKNMIEKANEFCKKNNAEINLKKGNVEKIEFSDESFDYVLCLNVLHCIETGKREEAVKEIRRVLKKNGEAIISVWNKFQKRFIFAEKESNITWTKAGKVYYRYYYLFTPYELKKLFKKNGFKILKYNHLGKNIIMRIKKE